MLDIEDVPELYVTQTPLANALTVGAKRPMVIIFSGLASDYSPSEVDAVLAHEMGHVLSEHYYYQTALQFLSLIVMSSGSAAGALAGLPLKAIYLVLLEWARAAELSSDRASALVVGDPLITCQMLMRIAGGRARGHEPRRLLGPGGSLRGRGRHFRPLVAGLGRSQPPPPVRRKEGAGAHRPGSTRAATTGCAAAPTSAAARSRR